MDNGSKTILVVDDDVVTCTFLQAALKEAGYQVMVANDGKNGIRRAKEIEPDLLLLDVMLPDISGVEVCQMVHDAIGHTVPPIIFISSLEEEEILKHCTNLGYRFDYIAKPIHLDSLLARIANTFELLESRKKLKRKNAQLAGEVIKRNRLAAIIEQFSDAVFIVNRFGVVEYVNRACELSGCCSEDLVGRSIWKMDRLKNDKKNREKLISCIRRGEGWKGVVNNEKMDGSLCREEISVSPIFAESGEINGYAVIKRDVTEQYRLESLASSVNLMENVGFIFSGIRHELGNPLNSLKMTLSVLSKRIDQFSKEQVAEFLDRSQNEISRIEYLLTSLRSFSMFENPVCETVFLSTFLNNVIGMHRKEFEAAQIKLWVSVATDAEVVYADPRALIQVCLNLFSNAVVALKGRPDPFLSIMVTRASGKLVRLVIEDNGCGISEENQKMLFKPFYTTRPEGTGLGLVIVRKMLTEMDCSIRVTSAEQEGTIFSILLPVGEE